MTKCAIPSAKAVSRLIGDLVDKRLAVKLAADPPPEKKDPTVALYANDDEPVALCVADLALAAHAGAALVLVPQVVAEECLQKGELEESISESFGEVLNVFAQLFAKPGAPRVYLKTVHPPTEPLPDEVSQLMENPAARLDLLVDVAEYGGGLFSVLVL